MGPLFSSFDNLQNTLTRAQATPIIGIIPSAIKILVSLAQAITSFAIGVIALTFVIFTAGNSKCLDVCIYAGANTVTALLHLAYAIINLVTLTYVGANLNGSARVSIKALNIDMLI